MPHPVPPYQPPKKIAYDAVFRAVCGAAVYTPLMRDVQHEMDAVLGGEGYGAWVGDLTDFRHRAALTRAAAVGIAALVECCPEQCPTLAVALRPVVPERAEELDRVPVPAHRRLIGREPLLPAFLVVPGLRELGERLALVARLHAGGELSDADLAEIDARFPVRTTGRDGVSVGEAGTPLGEHEWLDATSGRGAVAIARLTEEFGQFLRERFGLGPDCGGRSGRS